MIVAFIVALWAAYFVPLVLRRHDESNKNADLDVESADRRVVEPQRRVVSEPPTSTPAGLDRTSPAVEVQPRPLTRVAARSAARRRRNVLLTLLALTAVLVALAVPVVLPVWTPAIGVGLIIAWLILCRVMVRKERGISSSDSGRTVAVLRWTGRALLAVPKALARFIGATAERVRWPAVDQVGSAADEELTVVVSDQVEDFDPNRRNRMELDAPLGADALDEQLQIAVPSVSASTGEPMWDPLPITVPTYVNKPRAGRTVRTIEFGEPGSWTSGHVEGEQTELPLGHDGEDDHGQERHAVGH